MERLTSAQKRLLESDESLRQQSQQVQNDPSAALRYAVDYIRHHPEIAKAYGLNAFSPEDIQTLKESIETLRSALEWIFDRTSDHSFWNSFGDAIPLPNPTPQDTQAAAEDWGYASPGGWMAVDRAVETANQILNRQN